MIFESKYFSFDGRKSTTYGIHNIKVDDGLYNDPLTGERSILETVSGDGNKRYFFGVKKEPKVLNLSFAFFEPWNDKLINEIIRWLVVDEYKPLFFSENIDRVFYVMPINDIRKIHNGLKQGYITITMRCDSLYSYSHKQVTPWYDLTKSDSKEIKIINRGHYPIKPEVEIWKVKDGDIKIRNKTDGNREMVVSNLLDGEKVIIDCNREIIETDISDMYRYDDFNNTYLTLLYGENVLTIEGTGYIQFRYRYLYN